MSWNQNRSFELAQNFLRSSELVKTLVRESSIGPGDNVYEIGPGRGIITAELARVAGRVVAIEADSSLVRKLRDQFREEGKIRIQEGDFLNRKIEMDKYKVFSKIPFNATAAIVRKLICSDNPPEDAYLVMQREAAKKYSGQPHESLFSVVAKSDWRIEVVHEFDREDFEPVPAVDASLLRFERLTVPLIDKERKEEFSSFVHFGFGRWRENLKLTFKPVFTYTQWKRLCHDLGFSITAKPTELSYEQWRMLFEGFEHLVPKWKKERVYTWKQ